MNKIPYNIIMNTIEHSYNVMKLNNVSDGDYLWEDYWFILIDLIYIKLWLNVYISRNSSIFLKMEVFFEYFRH